jgi:hypothetical protein
VALGLVLGVWQGVKFGGAFYAGLALLLADVLSLALARPPSLRPWLGWLLLTGLTFLGVEAAWSGLAFALLPWRVAVDALWPQYMLTQYASLGDSPLPAWAGWRYFTGQQLTPLVGISLGVAALAGCVIAAVRRRPSGEGTAASDHVRLLIPLLFFLLGFAGYFRHVHQPLQYLWAGCLAGALLVDRLPRLSWLVLGLCWLPGLALVVKTDLISAPAAGIEAVEMPTGDSLYLTREEAATLDGTLTQLARLRSDETPGGDTRRCVLIYPNGAGMHHFYAIPRAGRHAWYLAGFLRPFEEADFVRTLDAEYAVVFVWWHAAEAGTDDPAALLNACYQRPVFSERASDALRDRLHDPVRVSPSCIVFGVRRAGARAPDD